MTWQRTVLAPFEFKGEAGRARKAPPPLVLALKDMHYRSLVFAGAPSEAAEAVPKAWLQLTATRNCKLLRGGVKKSASGAGSAAVSSAGLSLPSSTPKATRLACALSLPSSTPSRGTKSVKRKGTLSLPSQTPSRAGGALGSSACSCAGAAKVRKKQAPQEVAVEASPQSAKLSLCSATPRPSKRSRTAAVSKDGSSQASSVALSTKASFGLCSSFSGTCPRCQGSKPEKQKMRVPKGPNGDFDKVRKTTSKTCYPSQGAGTGWLPWWTCDQPNCSFKVMRHPIVRGHHEARRYHLTKVHGVEKVPRLHDEGPTTKRRRTKKEEALATQAKIEGVRARQRGNNNTVSTKPKPIRSSLFAVRTLRPDLIPGGVVIGQTAPFRLNRMRPTRPTVVNST